MMILQHGDPNKIRKPKEFKCDCGCIFVAEKHEYTSRQVDYDGSNEYEAICPDCHNKVTIDGRLERVETITLTGGFVFKCPYCDCLTIDEPSVCPSCKKPLAPASTRIKK